MPYLKYRFVAGKQRGVGFVGGYDLEIMHML